MAEQSSQSLDDKGTAIKGMILSSEAVILALRAREIYYSKKDFLELMTLVWDQSEMAIEQTMEKARAKQAEREKVSTSP